MSKKSETPIEQKNITDHASNRIFEMYFAKKKNICIYRIIIAQILI